MTDKKWVLVVDDEPDIRELIQTQLTSHFDDIGIIMASDGLEATQKLPFQAFDCIITDLKMPKKEGQAFIRSIRSSQLNEFTPIVVVTGSPDQAYNNSKDYIYQMSKPIDFDQLNKLVENQIKLGKANERLNADLVNNLVKTFLEYYKENYNIQPQLQKPRPKQLGDDMVGDFFRTATITINKSSTTVIFSFPKSLLENINKRIESDDTIENLIATIGGSIIRSVATIHKRNNKMVIDEVHIFDQSSNLTTQFNSKKALEIPFNLQELEQTVSIYIYW